MNTVNILFITVCTSTLLRMCGVRGGHTQDLYVLGRWKQSEQDVVMLLGGFGFDQDVGWDAKKEPEGIGGDLQ